MANVILNFRVNGETKQLMIDDRASLTDVLRDQLHLTSVKKVVKLENVEHVLFLSMVKPLIRVFTLQFGQKVKKFLQLRV